MPIFDYHCVKCDKDFEMYHAYPDDNPEICPDCGCESKKVYNVEQQRLRNPNYTPPPLAKRRFGEAHRSHHKRDKWY